MLGTYVEVSLSADRSDEFLLDLSSEIFSEIKRVETLMSFHNPNSELSQMNHHAHIEPLSISLDMQNVLGQALELSQLTQGYYDITIASYLVQSSVLPNHNKMNTDPKADWHDIVLKEAHVFFRKPLQIDLGGIAKGYAVDCAMSLVEKKVDAVINAGGDLRMNNWEEKEVGIRTPNSTLDVVKVPMYASALASSASYFQENPSVIISPLSKEPIEETRSVSVFAKSCMLADALTKVVFLYPHASRVVAALDAAAIFIDQMGHISTMKQIPCQE